MVERAERRPGRSRKTADQLEADDDDGDQADDRQADQEGAAQRRQNEDRESDDQQRPRPDAERLGRRQRAAAVRKEWHPGKFLWRSRPRAIRGTQVVVGSLDPGSRYP